jgi:ubiquinone/menaquinone biosynthesis C-methylase UbiE
LDPKEYELMFRVELDHWWYLGMRSITEALLDQYCLGTGTLNILDAGCGTGAALTTYLKNYGDVTGVDISDVALDFCKRRGAQRLSRSSVLNLPFRSSTFDLVTSFDVLYESSVPQDSEAIREFSRVLVNGGHVLLRLPAYDWLRSQHDEVIHTARRYTRPQVKRLLESAGLDIQRISYANTILFPFALAKRMTQQVSRKSEPVSDLALPVGRLNGFLTKILSLEGPLIAKHGLPYGLSVVALARKK